jgi:hypothetical protein
MKYDQTINVAFAPDVIELLQMAVGHLAMSIDDGSFEVKTKALKDTITDNLCDLHVQMSLMLSNHPK